LIVEVFGQCYVDAVLTSLTFKACFHWHSQARVTVLSTYRLPFIHRHK